MSERRDSISSFVVWATDVSTATADNLKWELDFREQYVGVGIGRRGRRLSRRGKVERRGALWISSCLDGEKVGKLVW